MDFTYDAVGRALVRPDGTRRFLEAAGWRMLRSLDGLAGPLGIEQMVNLAGTGNLAHYAMHNAAARVLIEQVRDAVAGFSLLEEVWVDDHAQWTYRRGI